MIKKITILSAFAVAGFLAIDSQFNVAISNASGSSQAASGDPAASGNTCAKSNCHNVGTATFTPPSDAIVIKDASNTTVVNSYTPGTTYKVNVKLLAYSLVGGFQLTVEDASSAHVGVLTASANTKILGSLPNYMTHKFSTLTSANQVWVFDWTAPSTASGTLTFYAAFNRADGSSLSQNDTIGNSSIILTDGTTGINSIHSSVLSVNPNPASDKIMININEAVTNGTVAVYSLNGELLINQNLTSTQQVVNINELNKGIYLVQVSNGTKTYVQKFIKD